MPQVNLNKCVNCKMCINICPVINYDKNHRNIVDKKLRMPLNQIMMNLEEYALQELYFYLLQLILLNTMALYMVLHLMEAIMLFINRLHQQVK